MSKTASQEIADRKAKYAELRYHTDKQGRNIGVSRLRPSQQMQVQEFTPGLDGVNTSVDDDPKSETYMKVFDVPKRLPAFLAAAVREIDGQPIGFPKNRGELFAILDRLEDDGLNAAGVALQKFNPPPEEDGEEGDGDNAGAKPPASAEEQAKN